MLCAKTKARPRLERTVIKHRNLVTAFFMLLAVSPVQSMHNATTVTASHLTKGDEPKPGSSDSDPLDNPPTFTYLPTKEMQRVCDVIPSMYHQDENWALNKSLDIAFEAWPLATMIYSYYDPVRPFLKGIGYSHIWSSTAVPKTNINAGQIMCFENKQERIRYIVFRGTENVWDWKTNLTDIVPKSEIDDEVILAIHKILKNANALDTRAADGGTPWRSASLDIPRVPLSVCTICITRTIMKRSKMI